MSYNSSTKTITAPVSEYDVQQALNTTEKDLGKLCNNENINKWARYKPVHYPELFSNNDGKGVVDMDTQTSKKVCGLTIPIIPGSLSDTELLSYYSSHNWEYTEKPTGGMSSPYRLTDFDNYFHGATPPISSGLVQGEIIDFNLSSGAFIVNLKEGEIGHDVISALNNNTNLKPAVAFYACTNSNNYWDMGSWELKKRWVLQDSVYWNYVALKIDDLDNNNVKLSAGYYALVIYLYDQSQNVSFLLPWDANNYFAAVYHATVLSWFEIKDYIWLTDTPSSQHGNIRYVFASNASTEYTPTALPTTFYITLPMVYVRDGYHDLNRDLVFTPYNDSPDQLQIIINGNSSQVYKGIPVNNAGNNDTITLVRQEQTQSIQFRFENVPSNNWYYSSAGEAHTNTISVITSHDGGKTWQGTATPDFKGVVIFK